MTPEKQILLILIGGSWWSIHDIMRAVQCNGLYIRIECMVNLGLINKDIEGGGMAMYEITGAGERALKGLNS